MSAGCSRLEIGGDVAGQQHWPWLGLSDMRWPELAADAGAARSHGAVPYKRCGVEATRDPVPWPWTLGDRDLAQALVDYTEERPEAASEFVDDLAEALGVPAADSLSVPRVPGLAPPRGDRPSGSRVAPAAGFAGRRTTSVPAHDTSLRTRRREAPPRSEARRREPPPWKGPNRSPTSSRRVPAVGLPSGRFAPRAVASSKPRRGLMLPALAALAVALIVALVAIAIPGGSRNSMPSGATTSPGGTTTHATKAKPNPSAPAASSRAPSGPGPSPRASVRSFYELAARGEFNAAWHLAGPRMRAAFANSVDRFRSDLGSLKSITFQKLSVTSRSGNQATLQVQTVARHTDHTDHCTGTLAAVRESSGWRVEPNGLKCSRSP